MTKFLLMRHGEADYMGPAKWGTRGWGADLAPLTERGIEEASAAVRRVREWDPSLIVASPMTRAMQTAAIVAHELRVPMRVEFDLHEWVPDRSFAWRDLEDVMRLQEAFVVHNGEWPDGTEQPWEPLSSVRTRAEGVLTRYAHTAPRILVVCHGVVMYALTGQWVIAHTESVEYSLS